MAGVKEDNIERISHAGADVFVAGSAASAAPIMPLPLRR